MGQAEIEQTLKDIESTALVEANAAGIYEIGAYGWLNENDVDDEYVGHAMWQLEPPLSHALDDPFGERPVQMRPTEADKDSLVAGEDFCGMMRLARMSIALALMWRKHRPSHPLDSHPHFWLHHTDAILKLSVAAERLRELMIVACTRGSVKDFERPRGKSLWYVTPFEQATTLLAARGALIPQIADSLAVLPQLAGKIYEHVRQRNGIVHEIATRMAKVVREQAEALQERYDREQKSGHVHFVPMLEIPSIQDVDNAQQSELDQALGAVCDWYKTLVNASNHVFQVEHWSRVKEKQST
jgi:hypothetical protein